MNTGLTKEQWDVIFDCVSYRISCLEDAKQKHPLTEKFIQKKIEKLDDILAIVGPLSI